MSEKELQRILSQPDYGIVGTVDKPASDVRHEPHVNAPESPLEAQFYQLWVMLGGPELKPQHKFEPMRRWRADFAHLGKRKVIIEIEGGIYSGGRHVRGVAFTSDAIKYNAAEMAGFHVIRLTSDMLNEQYIVGLIDWLNTD